MKYKTVMSTKYNLKFDGQVYYLKKSKILKTSARLKLSQSKDNYIWIVRGEARLKQGFSQFPLKNITEVHASTFGRFHFGK